MSTEIQNILVERMKRTKPTENSFNSVVSDAMLGIFTGRLTGKEFKVIMRAADVRFKEFAGKRVRGVE
jgi:hypothetical protein